MMNASFRTAFWAMCLGLTVPMMLFVGVELTSGGRTSANRKLAGAISPGSLQTRWKTGEPGAGAPRTIAKGSKSAGRADGAGVRLDPRLETETSLAAGPVDQGAILDPLIEPDSSAPDETAATRPRFPALPAAARPHIEIIPDDAPGGHPAIGRRIETQLDGILGHLDRLVTMVGEKKSLADPMQQAAELLLRLQEARRVQELAAQVPDLAAPEARPTAALPSAGPSKNGPPPPAPSTPKTNETAPLIAGSAPLTRIYRPRYIDVRALEKLATPLLTPGFGRIGAASGDGDDAHGDQPNHPPTQWDALVVRDTPDVLRKIDLLLQELDVPPAEILVEATVLTVCLDAKHRYGVDLAEFNGDGRTFSVQPADLPGGVAWSAGRGQPNPPAFSPTTLTHGTGVKCGTLRGDARAFLQAVQTSCQVRGAAASQTTIINKQSAELLLNEGSAPATDGSRPGSPGTVLRLRPIATRDGLVHLEIRPVLGGEAGSWNDAGALHPGTLANRLTLRPGETAVVGGFMSDHVAMYTFGKPVAGEPAPGGQPPRNDTGVETRTETIVLLTPHLARSAARLTQPAPADEATTTRQAAKGTPASLARTPKQKASNESAGASPGTVKRKKLSPPRTDSQKKRRSPRQLPDGSAAATDEPPRLILQAAGETPGRDAQKKALRSTDRKSTAPAELPEDQLPGSVDEIPAIPVDVDGMGRPVIRPASPSHRHCK